MSTETAATPSIPLYQRVANFHGKQYAFLTWLLANPSAPYAEGMRHLGLAEGTYYTWRVDWPDFRETIEAIAAHRGNLRLEASKALFEGAAVPISQAMVNRALGDGRDAQRAGERILETVGVLRKENDQQQAPIQVTTHTYVLVQPGSQPATGVVVEGAVKELPAPKLGST